MCECCVASGRTLVQYVKRAGHAFLLKWHDLATSWFVVREHGVRLALLEAAQKVLCRMAPNAVCLIEQLRSDGLLELVAVVVGS